MTPQNPHSPRPFENAYAPCGCWDPTVFGHDEHLEIACLDMSEPDDDAEQ